MINNKKKQVTIVVDEKQDALGKYLIGLLSEKGYLANQVTPEKLKENSVITSQNKVIYLGPSKSYNNIRKYSEPKYSEYGMEYGWHGNNCFVGVNPKSFKLDDREEIVKLFPEKIKLKVEDDNISKETEKNNIKDNFTKARARARTGWWITEFLTKTTSASTFVAVPPSRGPLGFPYLLPIGGYYAFRAASDYKNKKDLESHMKLANIINFVNNGLEEFMEKE
ncbi:hypothetical protein HZY88_09215 [Aerococcaceae bacterium DSM 111176]|nr:hypothetical protein [Aerococcaceae bacterium DSM 111176]